MRRLMVSVHVIKDNHNSAKTCAAMATGIAKAGDVVVMRRDRDVDMTGFDVAVLWGYISSCQQVIQACKKKGIPWVFIDMGYWRREHGYFKVSVNDRHPTAYLMNKNQSGNRWDKLKLQIKPWQQIENGYVLVAGMSHKAAWSWNLANEFYEKHTIQELHKYTKREIVYRPKPNWANATKINGSAFDKVTSIPLALTKSHCVVSHHSNVACDALVAGVPVFCEYGAASVMGQHDLSLVEHPFYPGNRLQWAANLAYCQWNLEEMASGDCWRHLKKDGLV